MLLTVCNKRWSDEQIDSLCFCKFHGTLVHLEEKRKKEKNKSSGRKLRGVARNYANKWKIAIDTYLAQMLSFPRRWLRENVLSGDQVFLIDLLKLRYRGYMRGRSDEADDRLFCFNNLSLSTFTNLSCFSKLPERTNGYCIQRSLPRKGKVVLHFISISV